ncbi:ABC transporter substrate-binding protein [Pontibacter harenae]|uniref:ABC transporter substrate-binding protein n=1 Tax=Pontibacter harenae TaxID=2894083 RepID=UPI001E58D904|nr:ABC transporter substrate-binding protein [Pontibacter harenae]MCC9167934.1 ABC transporter substrate-binding protein [Pontibacter harenae]
MRIRQLLLLSLLFLFTYCSQTKRQPDEVRLRFAVDPESLSPVSYNSAEALQVVNLMFQSLLSADLADDEIKPYLAESMPVVERRDSVTYITYTLRDGAKWSNGSPVTANDVAFTLKVLKAPLLNNEHLKPQVEFIKDIVVDEESPKKFTLVCDGYMPEMVLLSGDYFILPAYLFDPEGLLKPFKVTTFSEDLSELENNKSLKAYAQKFNSVDFAKNKQLLQGSAGYVLDEWVSGQYITLKRKDNWWGNNVDDAKHLTANPERISFQIIPDNTTALLAIRNKQLDVLDNIPVAEFKQLQQDNSFMADYALHTPDSYEFTYAGLNSRLPKFSDKRTRQAIAHLLDVNSFIQVTQENFATASVGPVPPSIEEFYNSDIRPYSYSVQVAAKLLEAAGWQREQAGWFKTINGDRQQLTIELNYRAGNNVLDNTAVIFQQSAAQAGIPVTIQPLEGSLLSQRSRSHNFDMFFRPIGGNPFVFNFKPLLHTAFAEEGGSNHTGFGTPESDELLDAINATENEQEKARQLKRLQSIIHDEAVFITLYYKKERLAIHKRFDDTRVSGLRPNYDVSSFTLSE